MSRRQKKQSIYFSTRHYKRGKNKKTKRKYTKIEARKQQGPKIKAQKTKYLFFVFMSSENQTENMSFLSLCLKSSAFLSKKTPAENMSFLSLCLNSSVFLSKNKNEDQSSIRPSLAPFSFKLFFYFEPDCGFRLTASNHSLTSNCVT